MASINWTTEAANDLKNIFDFIALDSTYYAAIHIRRIKEKTKILKDNPESGRIVPEVEKDNIRELIFGNYRIIYCIVNNDRIDILTIFHSARILKTERL